MVMKNIPFRWSALLMATTALAIASMSCFADTDVMPQVNQLESSGKFKEAAASLAKALESKSLPNSDRKNLQFELDRLERIKKDFPSTAEELFNEMKGSVKNLTREEFDSLVKEG